jgi:SAM-dependent methyltransferase
MDDGARLGEALAAAITREWPTQVVCRVCGTRIDTSVARRFNCSSMFTTATLERLQCPECDVIFGPWSLISASPQKLGELYRLLYRVYSEGATITWQEKAFYSMNPSRRGVYMNYACGEWLAGVQRLRSVGWNVWGYEPYLNASRCRPDCAAGLVDRIEDTGTTQFDGIFTHNFLEHPQDPRTFFAELHRLLKPGGAMAHSTPCFELRYDASPFHLYFFVGRSFETLCARTGFVVVERLESDRDDPASFVIVARCRRM